MTDLIRYREAAQLAPLADLADKARAYMSQSKAPNTKRAYMQDWQDFAGWCEAQGLDALPAQPQTVSLYVTDLADRCKPSTIARRMVAISQVHQSSGHDSPTTSLVVRSTVAGIRRAKLVAQQGKAPAVTSVVRTMVATLDDSLAGKRDRALLLLGFAGAFRRSELVALDVADVEHTDEGRIVQLRRSKTDQEGEGRAIGIPYGTSAATCPVRALDAWLAAANIKEGALFRSIRKGGRVQEDRLSDKSVALIVKQCAVAAGLDASLFSGHSLRAGLATSAAASGVGEHDIMLQTGHKSAAMVRRYIRKGSIFRNNAAASVGL